MYSSSHSKQQVTDPLALYASAIDTSNYISQVAPVVNNLAPNIGSLIDIGAGAGQLGNALRGLKCAWTAIEPSPFMQSRLAQFVNPPQIIAKNWQDETIDDIAADTVLAATMPAYFDDAVGFLETCKKWAKRQIIWVVAAQAAPKGLILAACLPANWHLENTTPGIDIVLPQLENHKPHQMQMVDWTFTLEIDDLQIFANFQADRLKWAKDDPRRAEIYHHLKQQAVTTSNGFSLSCHRRSAILVWSI
ncbi:hypothetical protein N5853_14170 (plasmid) [Bartonella sp. HY329]|uniref:hypothetical protein n=1 Tax=unclassified Bartonella TaxID=2645622 RepID=UPI0021C93259|nr:MULTISPECIES: hypothetical protein [unclassified Bartonella]UXM96461.1 hypothetical protein N5853_14170 [Bartonella sp. HY329]UXN10784.1 hypothetical protein N5852_14175 [Bartonella sp. HY328]